MKKLFLLVVLIVLLSNCVSVSSTLGFDKIQEIQGTNYATFTVKSTKFNFNPELIYLLQIYQDDVLIQEKLDNNGSTFSFKAWKDIEVMIISIDNIDRDKEFIIKITASRSTEYKEIYGDNDETKDWYYIFQPDGSHEGPYAEMN